MVRLRVPSTETACACEPVVQGESEAVVVVDMGLSWQGCLPGTGEDGNTRATVLPRD